MKKVIITTFFKAENYGAALQAYALEEILRHKGYDVEILNYRDEIIESVYKIFNLKRKDFYSTMRAFIGSLLFYRKNKMRHIQFLNFQNKYLKVGKTVYNSVESVKKNPPIADFYITGSDQVWNASITKGISDVYTLNFGSPRTKRIAYAASIGNKDIITEEKENLKEKISMIDYISVREMTAQNILVKLLPSKLFYVTLDPVLLKSREKWETDLSNYSSVRENYILAYFIEEDLEFRKTVNLLSKKTGLRIIHFEKRNRYKNVLISAYIEGPLGFVNLIKNAQYVVTTSFHGTAFSIIFQKKFWVFPNHFTGSRVTDLLDMLEISERAVHTLEEFQGKDYDEEIDYQKVNQILDHERENSLQWLSMALGEDDMIC